MKTLKQKIEIMTAADCGQRIESFYKYDVNRHEWCYEPFPEFDWLNFDYRIAEPEIAPGHNPDKLTVDQVEVHLGWQLLEPDELKDRPDPTYKIQQWLPVRNTWSNAAQGALKNTSYRTKLSREQLAAFDNPPPSKQRLPLGPEDFPPGNIFWLRHKDWNANTRTMVTFIGAEKLRYSAPETGYGEMTYSKLADSGYFHSRDGGKTWLPCYREQ